MGEYAKHWFYTDADYEQDKQVPQDQPTYFSKALDEAHDYAKKLSNPRRLNWVRVDWTWI